MRIQNTACTLHVARQGTAGSFDLTSRDAIGFDSLQAELTEVQLETAFGPGR